MGPVLSTHPLLPTDRIMVACPVRSARAAKAAAVFKGVSPDAIARALASAATLAKRFSIFLLPLFLPWNACDKCFQACTDASCS